MASPIQPIQQPQQPDKNKESKGASFAEVLEKSSLNGQLQFSKHAQQRLTARNISLAPQQLTTLSNAVEKAAQKGAKESLVLMNDLAFIVSVKNRTVVTAVDGNKLRDNVFTNIDSAVII